GRNFLRPAFYTFFNHDLQDFFQDRGLSLVEERGGRVFPSSNSAIDVIDVLVDWAKNNNVDIMSNCAVQKIVSENACVSGVEYVRKRGDKDSSGDTRYIEASKVVLATGGASYPATGSTGDGYNFARQLGHTVTDISPGLVPLEVEDEVCRDLQGVSLKNVNLQVWIDGKKKQEAMGEMLFTHFGVSGPIVLSLSSYIARQLDSWSRVDLCIDLKPGLDHDKLDRRLQRDFQNQGRKDFRNLLGGLLPGKLIDACISRTGIPPDKKASNISARERAILRNWLKDFRLGVSSPRPMSEAIITSGGVMLSQVDPKTMASRLISNLYFAGEVLDIDADTGGFNLQAAFSTAWLAGEAVAK
ncbi:MAG: NAD(P)/FAD-dependent oxidoreductase, partial [Thermodesulfobacteriota bacterium]